MQMERGRSVKHAGAMCETSQMACKDCLLFWVATGFLIRASASYVFSLSSPSIMGPFTNSTIPKYLASASSRSFVQLHGWGIMQLLLTPLQHHKGRLHTRSNWPSKLPGKQHGHQLLSELLLGASRTTCPMLASIGKAGQRRSGTESGYFATGTLKALAMSAESCTTCSEAVRTCRASARTLAHLSTFGNMHLLRKQALRFVAKRYTAARGAAQHEHPFAAVSGSTAGAGPHGIVQVKHHHCLQVI